MKKIARIVLSATSILTMVLVPVAVKAQDASPIVVDDTTALPTTGATPTTPDTGIAPPSTKFAQNIAVFTGGSLLGVGLGYGVITLRKKQAEK